MGNALGDQETTRPATAQLVVTPFLAAAIAFATSSACCSWKSVSSGLVGSKSGKSFGGSLGIILAIAGKSVRCATTVLSTAFSFFSILFRFASCSG